MKERANDMEKTVRQWHTLEETTDKYIGKKGTPKRDLFDADLEAALIGEAIKDARKSQRLTQRELGERVGVRPSQISKIERGRNLTINTIVRVLTALGVTADFSIQGGKTIILGR